jgi:hypothetical protein
MADSFDRLYKTVRDEVQTQRQIRQARQHMPPARLLGLFVETALTNRGRSRRYFARALDLDMELADAILDGTLPTSEIDDGLLADIAQVIRHDANTLRLILGREIAPSIILPAEPPALPTSGQAQSGG